nr:hypothetical protein [Acinetobacter nosocomialis]
MLGVLQKNILIAGVAVGFSLIIGNYIGKTFVIKMSEETFNLLLDCMLAVAGFSMIFAVFTHS